MWEASISGLDLAWEMGTLHLGKTSPSDHDSMQGHLQLERRERQRVCFAERIEVYVGFEDSRRFKRKLLPARPLSHQRAFHDLLRYCCAGFVDFTGDEEASDEVSWMSAHLPGNQGAPQPFLNREAAGVADLPTAVHQEDHIERSGSDGGGKR